MCVGMQQGDVVLWQVGGQYQVVEGVVFGVVVDDVDEGVLEDFVELLDVYVQFFGVGEGEVVDLVFMVVLVVQVVGEFVEYVQVEVFQDWQDVGQGQWGVGVVQFVVQLLFVLCQWLVEVYYQWVLFGEVEQVLQVDYCEVWGEVFVIVGWEVFWEVGQDVGVFGFVEVFYYQVVVVVLLGMVGLDYFFFQVCWVDVDV